MGDWRRRQAAQLRHDAEELEVLAEAVRYDGIRLSDYLGPHAPVVVHAGSPWPIEATGHLSSALTVIAYVLRRHADELEEKTDD